MDLPVSGDTETIPYCFPNFKDTVSGGTDFSGRLVMQGADLVSVATRKLYANHCQLYYCVLQTPVSLPRFGLHAGRY